MTAVRPVDLAEQALAGALLLDPAAVREVCGWLHPEDFDDPGAGAVYRAAVARAGQPADAEVLRRDLAAEPGLHPRHASPARLHDYMTSCPLHPEPVVYGRMVLEAVLRRQLQQLGLRVQAATLSPASPRDAAPVAAAVQQTLADIDAARQRWQAANATSAGEPNPAGDLRQLWNLEHSADRFLTHVAPPGDADVLAAERGLILELLTQPALLRNLLGTVQPDDFANPACANTYRAALNLIDQGRSVDPVTLAWEQQRASPRHGPGLPPADLRRLGNAVGLGSPQPHLDVVQRAALHRSAGQSRAGVQQAACNPGLAVTDLLHAAALAYQRVQLTAQRMAPSPTTSPPTIAASLTNTRSVRPWIRPPPGAGHSSPVTTAPAPHA